MRRSGTLKMFAKLWRALNAESTSQRPPAASIPAFAEAENLCADTVSAFWILPSPRILTGRFFRVSREAASVSGVTAVARLEAVEVGEVDDRRTRPGRCS